MSSEQNFTDSSMQDAQQIKQGASNAMNIGRKASEMKKKYDAAKKAKEISNGGLTNHGRRAIIIKLVPTRRDGRAVDGAGLENQ